MVFKLYIYVQTNEIILKEYFWSDKSFVHMCKLINFQVKDSKGKATSSLSLPHQDDCKTRKDTK